ncbi:dTDP-4-dehydrorhamnose reductase [bacterium]|nr:dTDP-4-dehydrorhamnose reductase [candidate division CSSED10-310 bacterium]
MKLLVTGARGMLGRELTLLLARDHEVTGIDLAEADITDRKMVERVVAAVQPEVIVHCAARTDVDGCESDPVGAYRVNGEGTANIALAARRGNTRLLFISTDFVFTGSHSEPYVEDEAVGPLNCYGRTKLAGEIATRTLAPDHLIVRTSWLYGAHGRNFVRTILTRAAAGGELKVVNDQLGSPTYVPDMADAISRLVATRARGVVHVCNSGAVTWHGFASEIVRQSGISLPVLPISSAELARPAVRPAYSVLATDRYRSLTGASLRSWQEALAAYLQQEKDLQPAFPGGIP